jgi:hypothetical protein
MSNQRIKTLEAKLTREQLIAAELLAVNRFLPREPQEGEQGRLQFKDIADRANISERQLYNWRHKDDNFIAYVNALATNTFMAHLPEFMEKHIAMTLNGQGSMKGIELFYKFGGLLVDKTEVKTDDSGNDRASLEERLARLRKRKGADNDGEDDVEDADNE